MIQKQQQERHLRVRKLSSSISFFNITLVTSIAPPSDWKHKYSTNSSPDGTWKPPWKTIMDSTRIDSVLIPCDLGQQVHLSCIYDNDNCLNSYNSFYSTFMTGTNHTSSYSSQAKFDTNKLSICIYNHCYVTMPHPKQDIFDPL